METGAGQQHVQTANVPGRPEEVIQQVTTGLAGVPGYTMVATSPTSVVFTRKFVPQWAIIVAIVGALLCLIGLLALLAREEETLTITAQPVDGGSRLDINGATSPAMRTRLSGVLSNLGGSVAPVAGVTPGFAPAAAAAPATAPAPAATPANAPGSPPAWHPDPAGRHEQRYWDGNAWTDHVMDEGKPGSDPPPR